MFENIQVINLNDLYEVNLLYPNILQLKDREHKEYIYNLNKKSAKNLYSLFSSDLKFSKNFYELDRNAWVRLFSFDRIKYEFYSILVNTVDLSVIDFYQTDDLKLNYFKSLESFRNSDFLYKASEKLFYAFDIDFDKSNYNLYALYYKNNMLIPLLDGKSLISTDSFHKFLQYDLFEDIQIHKTIHQTVDSVVDLMYDTCKLSLGELLAIEKLIKTKIDVDKNGLAKSPFAFIEHNDVFINCINSFKLPYATLKNFDKIKQALMYQTVDIKSAFIFLTHLYISNYISIKPLITFYKTLQTLDYNRLKEGF